VLAAVNKMDLADYREDVFLKLQDDFLALAAQLGIANVQCVPISALEGDNVVDRSKRMPCTWALLVGAPRDCPASGK